MSDLLLGLTTEGVLVLEVPRPVRPLNCAIPVFSGLLFVCRSSYFHLSLMPKLKASSDCLETTSTMLSSPGNPGGTVPASEAVSSRRGSDQLHSAAEAWPCGFNTQCPLELCA